MVIHVVKPGDTVYSIARAHDVPMQRIVFDNGLHEPARLTPGQALVILFPKRVYSVQQGDTLGSIAAKNGMTVYQLWQNNPQLGGNDRIFPGQHLVLEYEGAKKGTLAVNGYAYPNIDLSILRKTLPYLTYLSVFAFGAQQDGGLSVIDDRNLPEAAREFGAIPLMVLTTLAPDGTFSGERASRLLNCPAAQQRLIQNLIAYMTAHGYGGVDVDFEYIPPDGTFSGERASRLLNCPAAQQRLIQNLIAYMTAHGYGGVDVDFEYIPPADRDRYAAFITLLRQTLNPLGFTVFVALAPKTSSDQRGLLYEAHDYAQLGQAANNVLIMSYEWGYAHSAPMAVAPLNKVRQVMQYAVSAIPSTRIFMGIPNYGYDWTLPHVPGQSVAQSIGNVAAVEQAVNRGASIAFDETAQSPFYNYYRDWTLPHVPGQSVAQSIGNVAAVEQAVNRGASIAFDETAQSPFYNYYRDRVEHEVWFEDARSIESKLALAHEFHLHGVSVWNIMRYFPQLWLVLNDQYIIQKQD